MVDGRWACIETELNSYIVDVSGQNRANGAPIIMYSKNGQDNQRFRLTREGVIECKQTYKVIDIPGHDRGVVHMWENKGLAHQLWRYNDGYIENPATGVVLEIPGANMNKGTRLAVNRKTGGINQKWRFNYDY